MLLIVISIALNGFVFKHLFNWFLAYPFHNTPITFEQAIGITLLISFLKTPSPSSEVEDDEYDLDITLAISVITVLLYDALFLLTGYLLFKLFNA